MAFNTASDSTTTCTRAINKGERYHKCDGCLEARGCFYSSKWRAKRDELQGAKEATSARPPRASAASTPSLPAGPGRAPRGTGKRSGTSSAQASSRSRKRRSAAAPERGGMKKLRMGRQLILLKFDSLGEKLLAVYPTAFRINEEDDTYHCHRCGQGPFDLSAKNLLHNASRHLHSKACRTKGALYRHGYVKVDGPAPAPPARIDPAVVCRGYWTDWVPIKGKLYDASRLCCSTSPSAKGTLWYPIPHQRLDYLEDEANKTSVGTFRHRSCSGLAVTTMNKPRKYWQVRSLATLPCTHTPLHARTNAHAHVHAHVPCMQQQTCTCVLTNACTHNHASAHLNKHM